jgi:hypothetical protein
MKISLRTILFLAAATAIILSGCTPGSNSDATPSATATIEPSPTNTTAPTATASPTPTPTPLPLNGQQTQYFIDTTIDYYNRYITGTSRTVYTNKTESPINEMVFIVYPTIFQSAIYIKSLEMGDGTDVTNYRWESHWMVIPLDTPLLPGQQITFTHEFELYMPNREGTFGQTGRQLNLSYWFPMIPARTEEGWQIFDISIINSQIVGEHLVFEPSDFDLTLQFSDRRENFKIAAGTLPEETDGVLHYQMHLFRTLTLSISDIFTLTERETKGVLIRSYTFPEEASAGEAAADLAVDAINLYSDLYGPMEKDMVSLVEADFLHGMEFDGLVLLSRGFYMFYNGTPETNLTMITPHEISHQWFFSLVGNNQPMEPWLDESFATYSEALFYEEYYPELLAWWWENRVDNYLPSGYVDNTIYLPGGYEDYRDSVYLNGAHFMQDLRDTIGDDAFFGFIQDYVQTYRYKIAGSANFWSLLEQHTDADLSPLIEEYFSNPPETP